MTAEIEKLRRSLAPLARAAGVSDDDLRVSAGPLARTEALDAALAHRRGVLLLLGDPGAGKTLAAVRWLLAPYLDLDGWENDGGTWWPARVRRLMFRTLKSLTRIDQYDQREVDPLFWADRLVLDDLGQEYADKHGFLASLVDEVVTERHRHGRQIVMTANLSPAAFVKRYGERVVDRIAGAGKIVVCSGASLRRRTVTATIPAAFSEEAVVARAEACADRRRREQEEVVLADPPGPLRRSSIHGSTAPMTADEVANQKAEIARRLDDWAKRNAGAA
jgi:hypothetical protein